jgi:lipopolysaccharide export system protein LptA
MHSSFFNIRRILGFLKLKIFFVLILISSISFSQEKKKIEILRAGSLEADEKIAANAQRLIDTVLIRHNDILLYCDSAYTYTGTNRVDAFGNVHVNQGDTMHLYANKVFYNGDISFARAIKNVRLESKTTTLFTDTLDYDLEAKIGYYNTSGTIVDSTNTLTSTVGKYFVDDNLVHFYTDVEGFNENYTLHSDTLFYNTETSRMFIVGPTTIRDSANTIYAEDGWYDTKTGEAELKENASVFNDKQLLKANYIKYNEEDGNGNAVGSVQIEDFENKIIVKGINAIYNESIEMATVSDSAVLIMYSEKDTLFMHADTLRSAPDTIEGEKIITAFYGVRFYRSDFQGVCDSLAYFTKDSVIQFHYNPVIWSEIHQLSADLIAMKQNSDTPDELHLTNNSFIISNQDSGKFDQIKGKNMIGYIVENEINNITVDGNGQTLYYAREEENIIGLNRSESSKISIQFKEGKIHRIVFFKAPQGQLKPILELTEKDKKLSDFDWKIKLRPISKHDIFKREPAESEEEKELEAIEN